MADEASRLVSILEQQTFQSDSTQSEVGIQRESNHRYYTLQPLGNEIPGRSQYVAPVVPYHVEDKKAVFSEAFLSSRRVLKFIPADGETKDDADLKTAYVEDQLAKNDWFQLMRDGWHDAFVAKRMVTKTEWRPDVTTTIYDVNNIHVMQLQAQIEQIKNVVNVDVSQAHVDGESITGPIRVYTDTSHVEIKLIQPERYFRETAKAYPEDSMWCCHSEDMSRSELVDMGFDEEQVEKLNKERRFRRQEEDYARRAHDRSANYQRMQNRLDEQELITVYTTCSWLTLAEYFEGAPDEVRLYKIMWAAGELLMYENGEYAITEISKMPYKEWTQYKISHADHGYCDSDMLRSSQKTKSIMMRGALDNMNASNMGKMIVVKRRLDNLRDVTDPKIGGLIEAQDTEAIKPLPTPPLSNAWPSVMESLEQDTEAKSGSNRLAKGMNEDAMKQQNAASKIEALTNNANKRVMREVRDFAETYLTKIYQDVYELGARNDSGLYALMAGGNMHSVSPQRWQGVAPECEVHVALTAEEGQRHATALNALHTMLVNDPVLSPAYGVENRHTMAMDIADAMGISDPGRYMMDPESEEYMQMMQAQSQEQQKQEQMQMMQMQFQQGLLQSADGREWHKARTEEVKTRAEVTNLAVDNMRADEQLTHDKKVDDRKLDIEEKKA